MVIVSTVKQLIHDANTVSHRQEEEALATVEMHASCSIPPLYPDQDRGIKSRYVDTLQIWYLFRSFCAHSFGPLFYVTSSQLRSGSAHAPPVRSAALSAMPSGPTKGHRYPPHGLDGHLRLGAITK